MVYRLVTTFESWVTRGAWFQYATAQPNLVPHPLVDRSQCSEPFLDQFQPVQSARPLLSGICRRRTRYDRDARIVYVTRIDPSVLRHLSRRLPAEIGPVYFVVAALSLHCVHASHADAAGTFAPGRYGPHAQQAAFPPNLVHLQYPGAALSREFCVTHDVLAKPPRPHTPWTSTPAMHRNHYAAYRRREHGLPVAECRFIDGRRFLDPKSAPLVTPAAWGGQRLGRRGLRLTEDAFTKLLELAVRDDAGA
jgi:hypothetical protein